jgi:RimJ/RimL family protein N-acetyltransferase
LTPVYGEPVAAFVAARLGYARGFGPCRAIGFEEAGRLVAGVVYHNWSPEGGVIELSAASAHRRWVTRDALRLIFGYPFDGIGCRMAVARTAEDNRVVRRIWRALGATETAIPDLHAPGQAEIVLTLPAAVWRASKFARPHGQTQSTRAA